MSHDLLPVFVNRFEEPPLLRDLLHDVFRREDGLQVKPLGLHLQPFIYGLLDTKQTLLPFLRSYDKQLNLCRILKLTLQVFIINEQTGKKKPEANLDLIFQGFDER